MYLINLYIHLYIYLSLLLQIPNDFSFYVYNMNMNVIPNAIFWWRVVRTIPVLSAPQTTVHNHRFVMVVCVK